MVQSADRSQQLRTVARRNLVTSRAVEPPGTVVPPRTVVVVTGATPLHPAAVASVPDGAVIIAADGGLDHARAAGLQPDVLVGDLDSVSESGLAWASANIDVQVHPVDKSATDTELAIEQAISTLATLTARTVPTDREPVTDLTGPAARLILVAGHGDRLDHAIAALGALGSPSLDAFETVEGWWGSDQLRIATPGRAVTLEHPPGTTFSVLAMHGPCLGVQIVGARWPLCGADLGPLVGRGVSNEVLESPVDVRVRQGTLTVLIPGAQP